MFLDSKLTFNKPQDRLFAGQLDRMDRFALRYRALRFQYQQFGHQTGGLRGIRANLIPTNFILLMKWVNVIIRAFY